MTGHVKELSLDGSVAERLRQAMRARKIGAAMLARRTDVSTRLIRKYRAGTVEPRDPWGDPSPNGVRLAAALDVPVDELVPPRPARDAA